MLLGDQAILYRVASALLRPPDDRASANVVFLSNHLNQAGQDSNQWTETVASVES